MLKNSRIFTNQSSFVLEDREEDSSWEFELACQTNAISAVWNSIPAAKKAPLGLATFDPASVPALADVAVPTAFRPS